MIRILSIVFCILLFFIRLSFAETIDVQIKGVDDGVITTKQRDYREACLFAKREAIERAGLKIKAMTTTKDLVVNEDYIETKAEGVLLPGYNIIDMGYSAEGTYQVVLIGKILVGSSAPSEQQNRKKPKVFEISRDDRFIAYSNHVVRDKETNLEWIAGPDRDTNWYDAKAWVKNLNVDGDGWRMPTKVELRTLYKKGAGPYNMSILFKTTGWLVWSCETKGSKSAWSFSFRSGKEYWRYRDSSGSRRGFAVRSQK